MLLKRHYNPVLTNSLATVASFGHTVYKSTSDD